MEQGRRTLSLRRSGARPPLHLARALLGYSHLSLRERISAGRAALALGRLRPDDSRTLGEWLSEHGQSPRAIAVLWDKAISGGDIAAFFDDIIPDAAESSVRACGARRCTTLPRGVMLGGKLRPAAPFYVLS